MLGARISQWAHPRPLAGTENDRFHALSYSKDALARKIRPLDGDLIDLCWGLERIAREHDEIRELARLQRAHAVLFKSRIRRAQGVRVDSFGDGDFLVGMGRVDSPVDAIERAEGHPVRAESERYSRV